MLNQIRELFNKARGRMPERKWVLDRMPRSGVCAEIGVWEGDLSRLILKKCRPQKLHLIDPWEFQPDFSQAMYGGTRAHGQADMDSVFASVTKRFAKDTESGLVEIHKAYSGDAASFFPDAYFDWIYLDGNHSYEYVKKDLELFASKIKPGGYICGDDYCADYWWKDGVIRAVNEFAGKRGKTGLVTLESQFILQLG